jgi:hypothetical protein
LAEKAGKHAELHSDLSPEVVDDVLREVNGNHHEPPE